MAEKKQKARYYGEKKIKRIVSNIAYFDDDTDKVLTDKQMEYLVTDEPKDLTAFRDLVFKNVVADMMEVLIRHNIRKGDLQPILNWIVGAYNQTFNKAVWKAFGTYDESEPVEYWPENVSILDIQRIIG